MFLTALILRNFRNHKEIELSFSPKTNLIVGDNGVGKTSLLEAISLLSTGRSFRSPLLQEVIGFGGSHFYMEAHFIKEGISQTLKIGYDGSSKKIEHNANPLPSFSSLLGLLPSVLYAPKDISLIMGSPDDRRRFLNLYLGQKKPLYVHHLLRYTKALKHRNALLKKGAEADPLSLGCFEQEMALSSHYLMQERSLALQAFQSRLAALIPSLSLEPESFTLHYTPSLKMQAPFSHEFLRQQYERYRKKELLLRTSLVGPHRDDFLISRNSKPAKAFCSEGQKRCFLSALKLSEWDLLSETHENKPLMCIDDMGIHLDASRESLLEKSLHHLGQVFITSPKELPKLKPDKVINLSNPLL